MSLIWSSLQGRINEHDGVSNHQLHDCLLNPLFKRRSKKTSKLCVTGLCEGNSSETGEFPAQRASNAENVSIWWRHHVGSQFPFISLSWHQFHLLLHVAKQHRNAPESGPHHYYIVLSMYDNQYFSILCMMTSSNGSIFRVTGPLCRTFTGHRWIPRKGQWRGALMFSVICAWINSWANNREAGDLRRHQAHYDVIVM